MSDFATVIVSNDVCTSLGMSMPHEETIIPMPSNIAPAITLFVFILFFILVVNILVFWSCKLKHGYKDTKFP